MKNARSTASMACLVSFSQRCEKEELQTVTHTNDVFSLQLSGEDMFNDS
jgi:hypothetical protein